ncbi:MAG: hypothetical protein ACK417_09955 [Bacteroidia bacterium]
MSQADSVGNAKPKELVLQKSYKLDFPVSYFTIDNLGAYYLISRSNELVKYDEQGVWVGNHREQVLGPLRYVDATNPLQLLLFYPEVSALLQLDNMLYPTNRFNIAGLRLSEHSLVCRSFDNNFWLFDERAFRLRKLAFDLRTVVEGEWLQNELSGHIAPNYMIEHAERIYLNDPEQGIHLFDLYGRYLKTIAITGLNRMDFFGDYMYYVLDRKLYRYHLRLRQTEVLQLPSKSKARMVRVNHRGIYILEANELLLFQALD